MYIQAKKTLQPNNPLLLYIVLGFAVSIYSSDYYIQFEPCFLKGKA